MRKLLGLAFLILAVCALNGAMASSASARCAVVVVPGTGEYDNAACNVAGGQREYILVKPGGNDLGGAIECAEVENYPAEQGTHTEENCANTVGEKRWIKVIKAARFEWITEKNTFYAKGLASESVALAAKTGTEFVLESKVLGTPLKVKAKKLSGVSTVIAQGGTDSGKLSFSELTVSEPAGCKATSPIQTNSLKSELVEVGGTIYDKFLPATGEAIANVTITGCAVAETYPLKGTFFAQASPLFTELVTQPLTFSKAINEAAGGSLKLGKEPAFLSGEATEALSGANVGKKFGAK